MAERELYTSQVHNGLDKDNLLRDAKHILPLILYSKKKINIAY